MANQLKIKKDVFFLHSNMGGLFSIYYYPIKTISKKGDILYIHPFADEMNKSRRMAALQANSFAQNGFGVLQIDLFGCGDSSGEFCEATWSVWKENISDAIQWIHNKCDSRISLWGLRLGVLLIMDWIKDSIIPIQNLIFWQPVFDGKLAIKKFYRLGSASKMFGKDGNSIREIRQKQSRMESIEIGGYAINSELLRAIEDVKINDYCPSPSSRVVWREISLTTPTDLNLASKKKIEFFRINGCQVNADSINGNFFWNTVEISTVPELIASTTNSVVGE